MKTYHERTEDIQAKIKAKKKRRTRAWVGAIACCFAILLAFNLTLFIPYTTGGAPDLAAYRASEYYPVMEKLADVAFSPVQKTNNFERWGLDRAFLAGNSGMDHDANLEYGADAPTAEGDRPDDDSYREVTDNQVAGVTEGDLFKRSDRYLFYLATKTYTDASVSSLASELVLRAYTIAGGESKECGRLTVAPEAGVSFKGYEAEREMYLAEDLKTVTILTPCFLAGEGAATAIITVDTENVGTMSVKSVQYLCGSYISSRTVGGRLLVVNNFTVRRNPDFGNAQSFLPCFGTRDALEPVPAENILLPDTVTRANYTVLASVDPAEGRLSDCEALLSFSEEVYVSESNVYVTNTYYGEMLTTDTGIRYSLPTTEITRIAYEGGMFKVGPSAALCGTVKDRYCMDEYKGCFRVFADAPWDYASGGIRLAPCASLYLFDAATMQTIAAVERFSPQRETVQSARFDGDKAYVCTAEIVSLTDPVYVFDLSDPAHISAKDTGTVPGYSIALRTFYDGTLLGIGYGENSWGAVNTLKIEVYAETENALETVTKFEREYSRFSENYKAYYIGTDTGLVGLGVQDLEKGKISYVLLRFDGYALVEIGAFEIAGYDEARAFCADGYFYLADQSGLQVMQLD